MNEIAINTGGAISYVDPFLHMIDHFARDPSADIDKLERLLQAREREEARKASRSFSAALVQAQAEMGPVSKDTANQQTRSRYASYAALDRAVRPIYTKHGFGLSFTTSDAPGAEQVRIVCHVCHTEGHITDYHIDMPVDGKGARGGDVMTKTHAMGSGVSYGMRYLLKMIFNLATDGDDDGNAAGGHRQGPPPAQQQRRPAPPAPNVMTNMREGRPPEARQSEAQASAGRTAIAEPGKPTYWSDTGEIVEDTAQDKAGAFIALIQTEINNATDRHELVSWWNRHAFPGFAENGCSEAEISRARTKLQMRVQEMKQRAQAGS